MVRSRTFIATPPGATIKEQLIYREMNQKEFALRMGMSEKHISQLINGNVQLTSDTAERLEMVLGIPNNFWLNLEAIYRAALINVKNQKEYDEEIEIANKLSYTEMEKYGLVAKVKTKYERIPELRKFFEVSNLNILLNTSFKNVAYRRLAITDKSNIEVMAWIQAAKIKARDIHTSRIDIKELESFLPKIREMTTLNPKDFCHQLTNVLMNCGIALIFLPHLKGSFLQGASFIDGKKIVVGVTARGKDADKFWFSLFHEIAHIVLGHVAHECVTKNDEDDANNWARDFLIPIKHYEDFCENNNFSEDEIIRFAEAQNIAPGIVVGRLQYDKKIKYCEMNKLKEKYVITC